MSLRGWVGMAFVSLTCTGCSIATLDMPRSAPPGQSQPWRRTCGKALNATLVDVGVGLSGAALATDVFALSDDQETQKAGRIGGWVLLSTFAASALYGVYVVTSCESSEPGALRRAEQAESLTPKEAASFPGAVLQFQFGATTEATGRACVAKGGAFQSGAAHSLCRSPTPSMAHPDVRLEFRAGQLSRVTLVYPTTQETMQATLAQIEAQAASHYGPPRSGPNPWSARCVSNGGVQCLKDGELPGRAFWSFSEGDIELRPLLNIEIPLVELRHTLYEPGG